MAVASRTYTIAEAAVLGDMSVKTINNAIDKQILGKEPTRALSGREIVLLKIWHGVGSSLAAETRRRLFEAIAAAPLAGKVRADDLLIVDVAAARRQLNARIKEFDAADAMVDRNADIMGGEPMISGTRIPVRLVAAMLDGGASETEILDGYPTLTPRHLALAKMWVAAHPARGRPRTLADREAKVTSVVRVPLVADDDRRHRRA